MIDLALLARASRAFLIHDADGSIVQALVCDPDMVAHQTAPEGLSLLPFETVPPNFFAMRQTHYVKDGAPVPKQTVQATVSKSSIAATGADECVISGLPDPCTVTISGALSVDPTDVTGGRITLTCDKKGELILAVDGGVSWLPWETTITVT